MNCRFNYGMKEAFLASFCNNGLHIPLRGKRRRGKRGEMGNGSRGVRLTETSGRQGCVFRSVASPDAAAGVRSLATLPPFML